MVDTETGELIEKRLMHEGNAVRECYALLEGPVVVGIEATGRMQWFLELLEELGIKCRVGHPAKIGAAETRKQKHDRRDATPKWFAVSVSLRRTMLPPSSSEDFGLWGDYFSRLPCVYVRYDPMTCSPS